MEQPPLTGPGGGNYPPDPANPPAAPNQSSIDLMIQHAAAQYNIPPEILRSLLMQESGMKAGAVGAAGEIGLGQFMPATAQSLGIDPSKPEQAIPGAAMYLRNNLNKFGGDMDQALAAYNWGPGNVAKFGFANAPASVKAYVAKIRGGKGGAPMAAPPGAGTVNDAPAGAVGGNMAMGAPPSALASAVTAGPQINPAMLAQAGNAPSLGDIFSTTAQAWQQQQAKNVGLA